MALNISINLFGPRTPYLECTAIAGSDSSGEVPVLLESFKGCLVLPQFHLVFNWKVNVVLEIRVKIN
jgi:hypothetical protein